MSELILIAAIGVIAGFIDSIAGGGGLITLPALMLSVGTNASAIATNKIAGTLAALTATLVYLRRAPLTNLALQFVVCTALGSLAGTRVATYLPEAVFAVLLVLTAPLVLWLAFQKDRWVEIESRKKTNSPWALLACGFFSGLYDGAWGPGGGTLMLLSATWIGGAPLLQALLWSKLANTLSASTALASFAALSPEIHIRWGLGATIAAGCTVGATLGARLALKSASRVVRPVLAVVAGLLVFRVVFFHL